MRRNSAMDPAAISALAVGEIGNFLTLATPGGIEAQEAAGQATFVASAILPRQMKGTTREQLVAIGFVFGEDINDLFVACQLPPGWEKHRGDHSMWSYLFDDKGRKRAAIFYKAAFYDERADVRFEPRYSVRADYERKDGKRTDFVYDKAIKQRVFESEEYIHENYDAADAARATAYKWLTACYPQHEDAMAYWDVP